MIFQRARALTQPTVSFTKTLQFRHEQSRGETWLGPSTLLVSAEPGKHSDELLARAVFEKVPIGVMGDRSSAAARRICPPCPILALLDVMASVRGQRHFGYMASFAATRERGQVDWISCANVDPATHTYPVLQALVYGADNELRDELQLQLCVNGTAAMDGLVAQQLMEDFMQACDDAAVPAWDLLCVLGAVAHLRLVCFETLLQPDGKAVAMLGVASIPSLTMAARLMGVERRALESHLAFAGSTIALIHAYRDALVRRIYQAAMVWALEAHAAAFAPLPRELCLWERPCADAKLLNASVLRDHAAAMHGDGLGALADALERKFGFAALSTGSPAKLSGVKVPPLQPRNPVFALLVARPAADAASETARAMEAALATRYWLLCARFTDDAGAFSPALAHAQAKALGVGELTALLAASYPGRASFWECAALARAASPATATATAAVDQAAVCARVARAFGATEWRAGSSTLFFRGAAALETMLWDVRLGRDPRGECVKAMARLRAPRFVVRAACALALTGLLRRVRERRFRQELIRRTGARVVAKLAMASLLAAVRRVAVQGRVAMREGERETVDCFAALYDDGALRVFAASATRARGPPLDELVVLGCRLAATLQLTCERRGNGDVASVSLALDARGDRAAWARALANLVLAAPPAAPPPSPEPPIADVVVIAATTTTASTAAAVPTPERAKPARPAARQPQQQQQRVAVPGKVVSLVTELIETERAYVSDLHLMMLHYYRPLELALLKDEAKALLPHAELASIFSNSEQVLKANQQLLSALSASANHPEALARAFGELVPFLKRIYTVYVGNFNASAAALDKAHKARPKLAAFLRDVRKQGSLLDLESYLIKPVQRVCKYPLFFKQMVDAFADEDDPVRASFVSAFESVDSVAREVNLLQQKGELAARALVLLSAVEGLEKEGLSLLEPGRVFLDEFECDMTGGKDGERASRRTFFLYSDALIETKAANAARTKFRFKRWFELPPLTASALAPDDGLTVRLVYHHGADAQAAMRSRRSSTGSSVLGMTRKRISIGTGRSSSVSALPTDQDTFDLIFLKPAERDHALASVLKAWKDLDDKARNFAARRGSGVFFKPVVAATTPTAAVAGAAAATPSILDAPVAPMQQQQQPPPATTNDDDDNPPLAFADDAYDEDLDIL